MKARTKSYTMARLRHHVVPLLGHRRASEINAGDIETFVADVAAGKTASDEKVGPRKRVIVRGGAGAARKVVRDLSAVFSFASRNEIVVRNPCDTAAVRKTDNQNERFLTLEEVTRLGSALDELEQDGVNPKALNIARLWALTGCRRDEIALKSIDKYDDSDYVFPAERGDSHFQGTKTMWSRAIKKARLPGVTPHTLRHTMGSTATSTGEALALTGAILGHANPRSTAIYAHVQNDPSKRAANRVTKKIAAALIGKSVEGRRPKAATLPEGLSAADDDLIRSVLRQLKECGPDAGRLRDAIARTFAGESSDTSRGRVSRAKAR
jgi:integrase